MNGLDLAVSALLTLLLHASVARQVRVATNPLPHDPALVTVLTIVMLLLLRSVAVGASNVQALPNSTVLFVAQVICGAVVSTTVTTWLHWVKLLHASVARHVRTAK